MAQLEDQTRCIAQPLGQRDLLGTWVKPKPSQLDRISTGSIASTRPIHPPIFDPYRVRMSLQFQQPGFIALQGDNRLITTDLRCGLGYPLHTNSPTLEYLEAILRSQILILNLFFFLAERENLTKNLTISNWVIQNHMQTRPWAPPGHGLAPQKLLNFI